MTVTAPPRPPRPSDPVTHAELDALVEALIEEARQRGLRRRRRKAAIVSLVALVGVVLFALLGRSAQSQTASRAASVRSSLAAAAASSHIAFLRNRAGAFYDFDFELWVMKPDGSGQRQLAAGGRFPSWSPDGKSIAFSSGRGGNRDIYVMRSDGSHERRLTRNPADEWVARWSPDGRKLLFNRSSPFWSFIYVINADGTGEQRLADGDRGSWSPDGRKILFRRAIDPSRRLLGRSQLYLMNADGSGQRALTPAWPMPAWQMSTGLGWSPDGRKIVFSALHNGNQDVYVIDADGTGLRRLTRDPDADAIPVWSPDGRKIAFVEGPQLGGAAGYGPHELWVMNADGSGKRKLTGREVGPDTPVSWAPDSRTLAYSGMPRGEIYVVNADGRGRRNLTRSPSFDSDPVWSPAQR